MEANSDKHDSARLAEELGLAQKEIAFLKSEKEKRVAEFVIANAERVFQNAEKEKRAAEKFVLSEMLRNNAEKINADSLHLREVLKNSQGAAYKRRLKSDRYEYMSPVITKLTGYTPDEMESMSKTDTMSLINTDDAKEVSRVIEDAMSTPAGTPYSVEYRFKHKEGREIWLRDQFVIVVDDEGQPEALVGDTTDISKRKQADMSLRESEARYRNLSEGTSTFIWETDSEGLYTFIDGAFERLTGFQQDETVGRMHFYDLHPEDGREEFKTGALAMFASKQPFLDLPNQIVVKDGTAIWVSTNGLPLFNDDGTLRGYRGNDTDITRRVNLEAQLYDERNLLEMTFFCVVEGMLTTDIEGCIVRMNSTAETLTGWPLDEAKGLPIQQVVHAIDSVTRQSRLSTATLVLANQNDSVDLENTILVARDGTERHIEGNRSPIRDKDGHNRGTILVFSDCTLKKTRIDTIEHLSFHDEMTGLYNRRFYEEELLRLDTARNLPLSFIIGDVNGLKLVNDSCGHLKGDELLRIVAVTLKKECRADDILVRLSGDEFAFLLPKTGSAEAEHLIVRLKNRLKLEHIDTYEVSVAFGHATKQRKEEPFEKVFKAAEDSMYRSKVYESQNIHSKPISLVVASLIENNSREEHHSQHVSELCVGLTKKMGHSDATISRIRLAALMHDIGKIGVREAVLNKQGRLSDEEREEMQNHPEIGYRILSVVSGFSEISDLVLQHHERWDGTGYPNGLKGEEILLSARIISVVDAFEAMTSERTDQETLSHERAIDELRQCSGSQFDPEVVRVFIEMLECPEV